MKRLLIIDDLEETFQIEAEKLGYEVNYLPNITKAEALAILHEYDGVAVRSKFNFDKEVIDLGSKLKFIARAGAGMDNIDEAYAAEKKIALINAPEGNRDAVAEHAMGMLLSLMNNLRQADMQVRNKLWDREGNRGYELMGKTVAIIGYGNNGGALAKRLKGFGVKVLAYDKYKTGFSDEYVQEASMEEVVKHADVLSIHIPLTRETRQLVNDEYLRHFKKPIFFISLARGEITNTRSILNGIKAGRILGAGLDVLEVEKFPKLAEQDWYSDLINEPKVLLSPHVGGWTFDSYRKISEVLATKLKNLDL